MIDTIALNPNDLNGITNALSAIGAKVSERSFWDSNLFAAMIGAFSALSWAILTAHFKYLTRKKRIMLRETLALAESIDFLSPDLMVREASSISYGGTIRDTTTGQTEIIPEKSLNEKLIIELRKTVKWWKYETRWLRGLFSAYQRELQRADFTKAKSQTDFEHALEKATAIFETIKKACYARHSEDWYTIRR